MLSAHKLGQDLSMLGLVVCTLLELVVYMLVGLVVCKLLGLVDEPPLWSHG